MVSSGQASVRASWNSLPQPAGRISSSEKLSYARKVFQQIESDPSSLFRIISLTQSQLTMDLEHIYKTPSQPHLHGGFNNHRMQPSQVDTNCHTCWLYLTQCYIPNTPVSHLTQSLLLQPNLLYQTTSRAVWTPALRIHGLSLDRPLPAHLPCPAHTDCLVLAILGICGDVSKDHDPFSLSLS